MMKMCWHPTCAAMITFWNVCLEHCDVATRRVFISRSPFKLFVGKQFSSFPRSVLLFYTLLYVLVNWYERKDEVTLCHSEEKIGCIRKCSLSPQPSGTNGILVRRTEAHWAGTVQQKNTIRILLANYSNSFCIRCTSVRSLSMFENTPLCSCSLVASYVYSILNLLVWLQVVVFDPRHCLVFSINSIYSDIYYSYSIFELYIFQGSL